MIDAAFIHRRRKNNVGDLACSPGNYLNLGSHGFFDFSEDTPDCKLAILGGGQVFQECVSSCVYKTAGADKRVVWGVGLSAKDSKSVEFDLLDASCALVSTRNWGVEGCEYVPCASAMSPLFDAPADPTRDVVLFSHARKSEHLQRVKGIPELSNDTGTMEDAIAFLASAETVVTNSYHGTYWAMCLGRRVLCLPFNQKFQSFRQNPIMAAPDDWSDQIKHAERRNDVLEDARFHNSRFYEKVCNLS